MKDVEEETSPKNIDKWRIAIIIGIIFIILTSPIIFGFSDNIFSKIRISTCDRKGRPTLFGWLLHAIIFIIIIRILMK
jgi:hypothetical protein